MAPFHEDHYLIISPGSFITQVQFGLGDQYAPPPIEIPTKVYRHPEISDSFLSSSNNEEDVIYPIVKGQITNIKAFNFFLKLIYKSILKVNQGATNIPFLLVSSSQWSKLDIEIITQYVFESMELNAFVILPQSLAAVFAHGGQPNSLVIDIGAEKTEIIPVVDYGAADYASKVIPYGGNSINIVLQTLLPNLSSSQIESLKTSKVYEVLSDEEKIKSFFGIDGLKENDESEFDVAEIVTSGRTREILEEREKNNASKVPNSQLENNQFIDDESQQITVGKERFKGTEVFIGEISKAVHLSLSKIDDLTKRQESWDHIILTGKTSKIEGFPEALNTKLIEDNLVGNPQLGAAQSAFQANPSSNLQFAQIPNSIKFEKMPDYFPEWKKQGFSDISFLGAQIVSKQIFGSNNESMFVSRNSYNEKGPLAIWDIAF